MDLFVTMLGTAASVPTAARGTSATLIARGGRRLLIDCGEGTQRQLLRSGLGLVDVDAIFLTHLHADHYLGLPGLLKTYGLRGRERPLPIVGPRGLGDLLGRLRPVVGRTAFPLEVEHTDGGTAWEDEAVRVEAFPTRHSVPSVGFALIEEPRPGAFDVETARSLGVPEGPSFGVLQRGGEVDLADGGRVRAEQVTGPARAGRRVVVAGDTEPCDTTAIVADGASVLVHEATFQDAERERARDTNHSTAAEAGALARRAGVDLLVLTHLSPRCAPSELRREAEAEFPRVHVPRDFDQVEIPFPERSEPIVHRARDGRVARADPAGAEATATVVRHDL